MLAEESFLAHFLEATIFVPAAVRHPPRFPAGSGAEKSCFRRAKSLFAAWTAATGVLYEADMRATSLLRIASLGLLLAGCGDDTTSTKDGGPDATAAGDTGTTADTGSSIDGGTADDATAGDTASADTGATD
jgi:hypothetical protein